MDTDKRDLSLILHIYDYCVEIEQTINHFGNSYETFQSDKIYRNAITMCILQIGELAGRLSQPFTSNHPTVPWRSIKAMRNIAAHAYGSISIPDVWNTIINDIPVLKKYCKDIMGDK